MRPGKLFIDGIVRQFRSKHKGGLAEIHVTTGQLLEHVSQGVECIGMGFHGLADLLHRGVFAHAPGNIGLVTDDRAEVSDFNLGS